MCCSHQENNKMNKAQLKKIIKEELQSAVAEAHGGDSLGELERIADEFEEIAALSPSALIQRRLRELIERQRQAVAAHREEMSQPGW
jgi:acid stress-induced BolA-like protein IbaG/YrbA